MSSIEWSISNGSLKLSELDADLNVWEWTLTATDINGYVFEVEWSRVNSETSESESGTAILIDDSDPV